MILNKNASKKDDSQKPDINPVKEPYEDEPLPGQPENPPEKLPGKDTPNTIEVLKEKL